MASFKAGSKSYQSQWRLAGMVSLAIAGLMAAGSVWTGILRDTVVHTVRLSAGEVPGGVDADTALAVCIVYWLIFLAALFTAFFMAFLDVRYTRLQFALEQQRLFQQSLGDDLSAAVLDKNRKP